MPGIVLANGAVTKEAEQLVYSRQLGPDRGFGNFGFQIVKSETAEQGLMRLQLQLLLEILDELVMARLAREGKPYLVGDQLAQYQQLVMAQLQQGQPAPPPPGPARAERRHPGQPHNGRGR